MYASAVLSLFLALVHTTNTLPTTNSHLASRTPSTLSKPPSHWKVTNYHDGCSPAACAYSLVLTSPSSSSNTSSSEPSFNTTCTGTDDPSRTALYPCENADVMTLEVPEDGQNVTLIVRHSWKRVVGGDTVSYTLGGNATVHLQDDGRFPSEFLVPQMWEEAVA